MRRCALSTATGSVTGRMAGVIVFARIRKVDAGAYVYRGPSPERLRLMVASEQESAGRKPQLVDVLPGHSGFRR